MSENLRAKGQATASIVGICCRVISQIQPKGLVAGRSWFWTVIIAVAVIEVTWLWYDSIAVAGVALMRFLLGTAFLRGAEQPVSGREPWLRERMLKPARNAA